MNEEKIGKDFISQMTPQNLEYYKGSRKMNLKQICKAFVTSFTPQDNNNEYNYQVDGIGEFIERENSNENDIVASSEGPMRFEGEIKVEDDEIISINKRISLYSLH